MLITAGASDVYGVTYPGCGKQGSLAFLSSFRRGLDPRPGHGTLLRVDLKLESPLDEAGQARRDPVAGLFAADIDVTSWATQAP
jgi:hypothetical protein